MRVIRRLLGILVLLLAAVVAGGAVWQVVRGKGIDWPAETGSNWLAAVGLTSEEKVPVPHDDGMRLSLVLLSDLHINAEHEGMTEKLHMALRDVTSFDPAPDVIVLGGDLVDGGREKDYEQLRKILSKYRLPQVYGLMGNHEYYDIWYDAQGVWSRETMPNGKTDAEARERFIRFMNYPGRPYHDVWVNGVHLIMLSQEAYLQELPWVGEGAWYSDEQLNWLREVMKTHADGSPALVFIHQPLPPPGYDGGTHQLIRARKFYEILALYPNVFVFSGHNHVSLEVSGRYTRDATFHWFQNASVGKTWLDTSSQPNPVQGLYIQVYPDYVEVRGREFSTNEWIETAHWRVPLE